MILSGRLTSGLLLFLVAGSSAALAAEPASLGNFGGWKAYTYKAADTKVCYIAAPPKTSKSSKSVKRDPVFFIVTNMPGRKIAGEVSMIIGYPFKDQSVVEVKVDDVAFKLFTKGDGAWAESSEMEKQIVAAMKAGKTLSVKGTSWKGTQTIDTYSLSGIKAAMAKIDSACK